MVLCSISRLESSGVYRFENVFHIMMSMTVVVCMSSVLREGGINV